MGAYKPLYIAGPETGLVQERQEFLLPNDAYPILENAFIWRERIKRKEGFKLLGRLRRTFTTASLGNSGASPWTINTIYSTLVPPITVTSTAQIEPGSVEITIGAIVFTDQGDNTLTSATPGNSGTINYETGVVVLTHTAGAGVATTIDFNYFPGLPVMGLRTRETTSINSEELVAFDQTYAYIFSALGGFVEFIPGTTWTGTNYNFFWSTNFWTLSNRKLFWVTNFSGTSGDPLRYTDGITWFDFGASSITGTGLIQTGIYLNQCLCLLPFRGRLVAFNTYEGATLLGSTNYPQRIRWATIGNPLTVDSVGPPATVGAWRDDIRGQGGYLDIPTNEDIISVGFVRDNLVVYCERSTWQLRYTGRTIAPFQIEKVNSELGAESTFSAVQFDTSLVGIGDKGVVECDSFKSERIDIKIPDLVFYFNNLNNGTSRIHGIRDFQQRVAYWTYPYAATNNETLIFPNRVLCYNYENDSWAIFKNSFTCYGYYQSTSSLRWRDLHIKWKDAHFPWVNKPALFQSIVAGNQQGFVEIIGSNVQPQVSNDVSLFISNITGNTTSPTVIESPDHNLEENTIIKITGIASGPFATSLNDQIFSITLVDADNFRLWKYNPSTDEFNTPQLDSPSTYEGGGQITIRDNFKIQSKKFNFIDEGQNIQMGFLDILTSSTSEGAFSINVYLDYNDISPINKLPQNVNPSTNQPDSFFNRIIPTTQINPTSLEGTKYWQRVFCAARASFLTLEYTLTNSQMVGNEQESYVQIDAQILFLRKAGRQLPVGV